MDDCPTVASLSISVTVDFMSSLKPIWYLFLHKENISKKAIGDSISLSVSFVHNSTIIKLSYHCIRDVSLRHKEAICVAVYQVYRSIPGNHFHFYHFLFYCNKHSM